MIQFSLQRQGKEKIQWQKFNKKCSRGFYLSVGKVGTGRYSSVSSVSRGIVKYRIVSIVRLVRYREDRRIVKKRYHTGIGIAIYIAIPILVSVSLQL